MCKNNQTQIKKIRVYVQNNAFKECLKLNGVKNERNLAIDFFKNAEDKQEVLVDISISFKCLMKYDNSIFEKDFLLKIF